MFVDESADSAIKLIDFGLSEIFSGDVENTQQVRGSIIYTAPEAFKDGGGVFLLFAFRNRQFYVSNRICGLAVV